MIRVCRMFLLLGLPAVLIAAGCSQADRGSMSSYGNEHLVELYSGGTKVREWKSTGKVFAEETGDGFYFKDAETGQVVRVTGDVVVTTLLKTSGTTNPKQKPETVYDLEPGVDAGDVINGTPNPFNKAEMDRSL